MIVVSFQFPVTVWASTRTVLGVVVLSEMTLSVLRTAEVTSLSARDDRSNFISAIRSALPLKDGFVCIPYWVP